MSRSLADLPLVEAAALPALSRGQMADVDRIAVEVFGLGLLQMMENAGLWLAETVRLYLGGSVAGREIAIGCGKGNNGGGGLAAARRLSIWGASVTVVVAAPLEVLAPGPAAQLRVLRRSAVPVQPFDGTLPAHDILVDAIVGYNLHGALTGAAADAVEALNASGAGVIALDLPSGVDADTGAAQGLAVRATATVTLALPKAGLLAESARGHVGQVLLADIGIPDAVYREAGIPAPPGVFSSGPLVRVRV
ncbi:MAG TPA: NAD(P)H-hydrate epimerase [Dehalococcoidia bacterium]|nr:NAD(P)H-hydrate epimerase [Dehalococcoidia bacterium]